MRTYETAFEVSTVVLLVVLVLIGEMMRRQVHEARYGNQQISPWDRRFVNDLLGRSGIWGFHKQLYQRSSLRLWFLVVLAALLTCLALSAYVYLQAHR